LFKIDPKTGNRTVVVKDLSATCASAEYIPSLAVNVYGNILLGAEIVQGRELGQPGMLFSFDPFSFMASGCSPVTDFADHTHGELGERMGTIAVTPILRVQPVDLTIANMEITQGIQNFANDVPLVADKTTYVRV